MSGIVTPDGSTRRRGRCGVITCMAFYKQRTKCKFSFSVTNSLLACIAPCCSPVQIFILFCCSISVTSTSHGTSESIQVLQYTSIVLCFVFTYSCGLTAFCFPCFILADSSAPHDEAERIVSIQTCYFIYLLILNVFEIVFD